MRVTRQTKKPVQKPVNKKSKKKSEKKVPKPSIDDILKLCESVKVVLVKDVFINSLETVESECKNKYWC